MKMSQAMLVGRECIAEEIDRNLVIFSDDGKIKACALGCAVIGYMGAEALKTRAFTIYHEFMSTEKYLRREAWILVENMLEDIVSKEYGLKYGWYPASVLINETCEMIQSYEQEEGRSIMDIEDIRRDMGFDRYHNDTTLENVITYLNDCRDWPVRRIARLVEELGY